MAQPIPLEIQARDPRAELQDRLARAPQEHAEALLSAYEVLQKLHERGALDLMRGALGSSDKVLEIVLQEAQTPAAVRGLRNLLILGNVLGSVEPNLMEGFARSIPEAIALTKAHAPEPPGLWGILKKFGQRDFRRGLVLVNSMLEAFGRNLAPEADRKALAKDQPLGKKD